MAKIEGRPSIGAQVVIVLSEAEAGALDALASYGTDEFLRWFYQHMGASYLKPYEAGLRSLFDSVRNGPANIGAVLDRVRSARQVFDGERVAAELPRKADVQ